LSQLVDDDVQNFSPGTYCRNKVLPDRSTGRTTSQNIFLEIDRAIDRTTFICRTTDCTTKHIYLRQ